MMKISLILVFLTFIVSMLLIQPHNCKAASLSLHQNNTASVTACDSDHRCLIADVTDDRESFGSDPRFVSSLASNSLSITAKTLNTNPSVSCPTPNGQRYTSCLGVLPFVGVITNEIAINCRKMVHEQILLSLPASVNLWFNYICIHLYKDMHWCLICCDSVCRTGYYWLTWGSDVWFSLCLV